MDPQLVETAMLLDRAVGDPVSQGAKKSTEPWHKASSAFTKEGSSWTPKIFRSFSHLGYVERFWAIFCVLLGSRLILPA